MYFSLQLPAMSSLLQSSVTYVAFTVLHSEFNNHLFRVTDVVKQLLGIGLLSPCLHVTFSIANYNMQVYLQYTLICGSTCTLCVLLLPMYIVTTVHAAKFYPINTTNGALMITHFHSYWRKNTWRHSIAALAF